MSIEDRVRNYLPYMEKFGIRRGMKIAKTLFPKKPFKKVVSFRLTGYSHPIFVRLGTSDVTNFLENFLHDPFRLPPLPGVKLIIDAGANAGFASIFFLNTYPAATVIAVEPESSNFEALKRNCSCYPNFKSIHSAIWKSNTSLKIIDQSAGKTAFRVVETSKNDPDSFPAVTFEKILADSGFSQIDILKIDIEGAEKEIFKENYKNWIDRVEVMIIELHDRIVPGCALSFYSAMETQNFMQYECGKNLVYVRKK